MSGVTPSEPVAVEEGEAAEEGVGVEVPAVAAAGAYGCSCCRSVTVVETVVLAEGAEVEAAGPVEETEEACAGVVVGLVYGGMMTGAEAGLVSGGMLTGVVAGFVPGGTLTGVVAGLVYGGMLTGVVAGLVSGGMLTGVVAGFVPGGTLTGVVAGLVFGGMLTGAEAVVGAVGMAEAEAEAEAEAAAAAGAGAEAETVTAPEAGEGASGPGDQLNAGCDVGDRESHAAGCPIWMPPSSYARKRR